MSGPAPVPAGGSTGVPEGTAAAAGDVPDEGRLRRVHPVSPVLRGGIVVVALAIAAGRQLVEGGSLDYPPWIVAAVLVAVVGWGVVSWWFTRYRLGGDTLLIESGIVIRRSRRIRLDRVQAVEVQQPLLARLFGMAELAIETAGSGTEATLAFLPLAQAHDLREELLRRSDAAERHGSPTAHGAHGTDGFGPATAPAAATAGGGTAAAGLPTSPQPSLQPAPQPAPQPTPQPTPHVLHRVPPGQLLVSQLVRSAPLLTTLTAGAAVAVMVMLGTPLGFTVAVPAVIAVVSTVAKGFVGQYGFVLTRTTRGLGVRAGLLDVRSQSIPVDRVQGVVVVEPLVWRWLGWCEIQVTVAGVENRGDEDARLTTTLLPVVTRAAGARLAADALGGRDLGEERLRPVPRAARWLDPIGWRVQALGFDDDLVVSRRGVLVRRTDLVPRHKVQSCAIRQGPVQRRLGLATLHVHLPTGPVDPEGRHREPGEAWELALTLARPHRGPSLVDQPRPAGM